LSRKPRLRPVTFDLDMTTTPGDITGLLTRWSEGDQEAFLRLVALAYDDLRAIAHRRLVVRGGGDTIDTTALVHEVFLKLVGHEGGAWESRAHFYAFASKAMRHILVDHARRARAERRGGDLVRIPLEAAAIAGDEDSADVLGVDEALERLAERDERMARVVELRFFGGLTVPEVAMVLDTSVRTVERDWTRARTYLLETLENHASD
jgi:RNA polymerase sigma factor (TIGR02999 family)